jgi:hypothetical protein
VDTSFYRLYFPSYLLPKDTRYPIYRSYHAEYSTEKGSFVAVNLNYRGNVSSEVVEYMTKPIH